MKKSSFLKAAAISALLISITPFAAESAEHSHHMASGNAASAGSSALIEEMKALDAVFREVVSAVALGDGHRVHLALEACTARWKKTQEALHG
jgi:hypothetical protein